MNLNEQYVLSWDTETTGVSVHEDRIVTASVVLVDPNGDLVEHWEWLINPGIDIAEGASAVHGITNEVAQESGVDPMMAVYEIASVVSHYMRNKVPTVAYNGSFDFSLLNAECKRHLGYDFYQFFPNRELPPYIIDPYVMDKRLNKYRKGSRTLTATAEVYGIDLENAHASYDDCVAAVGVARALWDKFPVLSEGEFEGLFEQQQKWYREQQEGLARYFEQKGEPKDINTLWPIST